MIVLLLLAVALVYGGACAAAGFGPPGSLDGFEPDQRLADRLFRQPPVFVLDGYLAGVGLTPGMRVAEERGAEALVDLRPTSRILDGNFGLAIRLRFLPEGAGTRVVVEARNKVRFAWSNHAAALRHAESALRMNAKAAVGLDEVVAGFE